MRKRLLIMACSQRKRPDEEALPAIKRYDGGMFRVLKKAFRDHPKTSSGLSILILSTKFGLLKPQSMIPDYNAKMTLVRARQIRGATMKQLLRFLEQHSSFDDVCFAMGRMYLTAFDVAAIHPHLAEGASLTITRGSVGVHMKQLKQWLLEVV